MKMLSSLRAINEISYIKLIAKSILDSIIWLLLTTLVGLVQIWIYFILSLMIKDIQFELLAYFKNGMFLLFSMALVASIYFDIHYIEKITADRLGNNIIFKLFPWAVVGMTCLSVICQIFPQEKLKIYNIQFIQYCTFLLAISYSLVYKYIIFINNYLKNNGRR